MTAAPDIKIFRSLQGRKPYTRILQWGPQESILSLTVQPAAASDWSFRAQNLTHQTGRTYTYPGEQVCGLVNVFLVEPILRRPYPRKEFQCKTTFNILPPAMWHSLPFLAGCQHRFHWSDAADQSFFKFAPICHSHAS